MGGRNGNGNFITDPPNGPVLFYSLASVGVCRLSSSVTLPAGGQAGRPPGTRAVGRPTHNGGPVLLRPVRATPCCWSWNNGKVIVPKIFRRELFVDRPRQLFCCYI